MSEATKNEPFNGPHLYGAEHKKSENITSISDLLVSFLSGPLVQDQICAFEPDTKSTLKFSELKEKSFFIGRMLQNYKKVALCMTPSLEYITTVCGVVLSGLPYVPIDPDIPKKKLRYIINESGVDVVLCHKNFLFPSLKKKDSSKYISVQDFTEASNPILYTPKSAPEIFCILYTSGSSGKSKGTLIPHRALLNRLFWQWRAYPFDRDAVCCVKTSIGFVDSLSEIWAPLLKAVPIVVVPKKMLEPSSFVWVLNQFKITRLILVPSLLTVILEYLKNQNQNLPNLKEVICSGETLQKTLAENFFELFKLCSLSNFYGSTEIMADATYQKFTCLEDVQEYSYENRLSIGRPIDNMRLYLYQPDERGVGEMVFAGDGVTKGYLNIDGETHCQKFVKPNDLGIANETGLLFRTGDQAKLVNGFLVYFGRHDTQVKIDGNRTDLSEIDAVLRNHCHCKAPVVLYAENRIIAFLSKEETPIKLDHQSLRKYLPSYAIPLIFAVSKIPLLPVSGKVDRVKLINKYKLALERQFSEPSLGNLNLDPITNAKLLALVKVFSEIGIHINDLQNPLQVSFYDIGGTSLNTIHTIAKLKQQGYNIPLKTFLAAKHLSDILNGMQHFISPELNETPGLPENLEIIPSKQLDKEESIRFVISRFIEKDPPHIALNKNDPTFFQDSCTFLSLLWPHLMQSQTCFGFRDKTNQKLIGVYLSFDHDQMPPNTPPDLLNDLYNEISTPVIHYLQARGLNKILESFMVSIDADIAPSEKVRLVVEMEKEIIKIAQKQGFQVIITINTNELTKQLANFFGYELVSSFDKMHKSIPGLDPEYVVNLNVKYL